MENPNPSLRVLPPEVRTMVFPYVLKITKTSKIPDLLIALRCDRILYPEALKVYYDINSFEITNENIAAYEGKLSSNITARIKALTFDY
jgi:hypothetical protein